MIEEKEITFLAFDLSLEGLEQTTGEGWLGADKKFFAKKKHDIYPLNETRATIVGMCHLNGVGVAE